jgi:hypothetical protein
MKKTTRQILNEFIRSARMVEEKTAAFLPLNFHQLNWRPAENMWSIAECFEHLIRTNEKYIPFFQKYSSEEGSIRDFAFKHTFVGKLLINSLTPDVKRKYKTPASFDPIGSTINSDIVNDFLNWHKSFVDLVRKLDHTKFTEKITSPFSKLVKYSIGDSLVIISNHNLRHLNQAERVIKAERFPS